MVAAFDTIHFFFLGVRFHDSDVANFRNMKKAMDMTSFSHSPKYEHTVIKTYGT